ncbi:hypothetical protein [uncultured Sphingomonas sp.]|uniref:hypothetical protein n=1 Tax=uncultured Sphingomonas sp. TaxID=158754 RepID=UPI0025F92C89|nr:hypothetical protein [uncultured Sphingomonas sp.]
MIRRLLPPPWNWIVGIVAPLLLLAGAYGVGNLHGARRENTRLSTKYDAAMQRALHAMEITAERLKRIRAEAAAADLAHARAVEAAQSQATLEESDAFQRRLDAARALADGYARQLRGQAAQGAADRGGSGSAHQPQAARPAAGAAGAGAMPVLDDGDLLICTENTVKAQGWFAWWKRIRAIPR